MEGYFHNIASDLLIGCLNLCLAPSHPRSVAPPLQKSSTGASYLPGNLCVVVRWTVYVRRWEVGSVCVFVSGRGESCFHQTTWIKAVLCGGVVSMPDFFSSEVRLLIWRLMVRFPMPANLDFPPLCITYSVIKGQLLWYHVYMVWEVKDPLSR